MFKQSKVLFETVLPKSIVVIWNVAIWIQLGHMKQLYIVKISAYILRVCIWIASLCSDFLVSLQKQRTNSWCQSLWGCQFWCQCNINYVFCHISILQARHIILPKSQTQSSEWLKSSLRPDFRETCVRPHMCVKESQPDSGEVEVRKRLTKRVFHRAEHVCPWALLSDFNPAVHL